MDDEKQPSDDQPTEPDMFPNLVSVGTFSGLIAIGLADGQFDGSIAQFIKHVREARAAPNN